MYQLLSFNDHLVEIMDSFEDQLCYNCKLSKMELLQRCSACKRVYYCSKSCQRNDWKSHKTECHLTQEENELALALSHTDPKQFGGISDASQLRSRMITNVSSLEPFHFVLRELRNCLVENSMAHWDPNNEANNMAVVRMDALLTLVTEISKKVDGQVNWVKMSSLIFGTMMVHNAINAGAKNQYKFGNNPWFESYLYNFGIIADKIKLYAILYDNDFERLLPDCEFPLIQIRTPTKINGRLHFPHTKLKLPDLPIPNVPNEDFKPTIRCMICRRKLKPGDDVVSPYDPDRKARLTSENFDQPRLVNFIPPRTPVHLGPEEVEKCKKHINDWINFVVRNRSLPKDWVCSLDCEQHALYGRLFPEHPLEKSKSESNLNPSTKQSDQTISK